MTPESVGLASAPQDAVAAGTPEKNAGIARKVLGGDHGAERDLTVLNAGAAIYVGGGAESIEAGARAAEQAIDSGAAADVLERFVARTGELASVNVRLEGLVEATRDALERRKRTVPLAELERATAGEPRGSPVRRGAGGPRHLADRRAQAPLPLRG